MNMIEIEAIDRRIALATTTLLAAQAATVAARKYEKACKAAYDRTYAEKRAVLFPPATGAAPH